MLLEKNEIKLLTYTEPQIDLIVLSTDVITESHFDPNMGEWDTDM